MKILNHNPFSIILTNDMYFPLIKELSRKIAFNNYKSEVISTRYRFTFFIEENLKKYINEKYLSSKDNV